MLMGNYRFRLSDMMPNAWLYKLRDMTHGARNNPNHHHHHHHRPHHQKTKKKRRTSNSSAPTSTSASNATSAAPSRIVPRLSYPTYNKLYHSPRLSDLYSPRNHKASDIPLPPPTPSTPTSRISSSSSSSPPTIMLSKTSKSKKSLGHIPSPTPTRRPLQHHHHHHHQEEEEEITTIIPPTTSRSLITSTNACNHHHMHYYSLSASSPSDSSSLWGESNSYCHHLHNNNSSSIYGLLSSDDQVGTGRSSGSCRVSSSTADLIIDLNMDQNSFTHAQLQLVSEPLDHELYSPTILIDPAAIFNDYHDENNSSAATARSRTGTMTTTTTTTTTTSSRKCSCSKGRQFEDIESGGGPSSSSSSQLQEQLSVRINYVTSEERNISSNSSKRSCKESAVNSNIEVSSCSKYSSRSSRAVTVNTSASPAAGPGGIRGVKLRLGTKTPRIACNKKVVQAQAINGTRKSISANSPRRRTGSKNLKSTRRSATTATTVLSDSFAVVKSSCDPQRDFRESMTEMIIENNIRASRDLEDLLACYLTLNSNHYHQLILKAFEQIWFHMFYDDEPSIPDLH